MIVICAIDGCDVRGTSPTSMNLKKSNSPMYEAVPTERQTKRLFLQFPA